MADETSPQREYTAPLKYGLSMWRLQENQVQDVCAPAFLPNAQSQLVADRAALLAGSSSYVALRVDGSDFAIADGGSGCYANANITTPALRSEEAFDLADPDENNYPSKVNYRSIGLQTIDGDCACISLGAATDAPVPRQAIVDNFGGIQEFTNTATDITWSPELAIFCMVSSSGSALGDRVRISTDGVTWQSYADLSGTGLSADVNFWRVRWFSALRKFVAVGGPSIIATSPDGIHWTEGSIPAATQNANVFYDVAFADSLNRLVVAKVSSDATIAIVYSDDAGLTWSLPPNLPAGTNGFYTNVAWSPELGIFTTLNQAGSTPTIGVLTSNDGISWEALDNSGLTTTAQACVWSRQLQLFIATGGASGVGKAWTSPDGKTWTERTIPPDPVASAVNRCNRLTWVDDLRCAFGAGERGIMYSFDGITWAYPTTHPETVTPSRQFASCIAWSPSLGKAVTIAAVSGFFDDDNRIFYSTTPFPPLPSLAQQPLVLLCARCEGPVGWQIGGQLGFPDFAQVQTSLVLERRSVEGFIVYAAARQVRSPGFPTICNVIMLLGRFGWNSTFGQITLRSSELPSSNGFAYMTGPASRGLMAAHLVLTQAKNFIPEAGIRRSIAAFLRSLREAAFSRG